MISELNCHSYHAKYSHVPQWEDTTQAPKHYSTYVMMTISTVFEPILKAKDMLCCYIHNDKRYSHILVKLYTKVLFLFSMGIYYFKLKQRTVI